MPAMLLHRISEVTSERDVFRFRAHGGTRGGLGRFSKHELFHIIHRTSSQVLNKIISTKKHTQRLQEENEYTLKL